MQIDNKENFLEAILDEKLLEAEIENKNKCLIDVRKHIAKKYKKIFNTIDRDRLNEFLKLVFPKNIEFELSFIPEPNSIIDLTICFYINDCRTAKYLFLNYYYKIDDITKQAISDIKLNGETNMLNVSSLVGLKEILDEYSEASWKEN